MSSRAEGKTQNAILMTMPTLLNSRESLNPLSLFFEKRWHGDSFQYSVGVDFPNWLALTDQDEDKSIVTVHLVLSVSVQLTS